jgi:phosphoglycerate kinase
LSAAACARAANAPGKTTTANAATGDNVALCAAIVALSEQLANADHLAGRAVLLRLDLNAPTDAASGAVVDDSRIAASMPVIELLRAKRARIVVASHFGRPNPHAADVAAERARHSLAPVASVLARRLPPGSFAGLAPAAVGPAAAAAVEKLAPGQVLLLENLRLHAGETADDPSFAADLAALAEVYVGDAFGVTHRAHASVSVSHGPWR